MQDLGILSDFPFLFSVSNALYLSADGSVVAGSVSRSDVFGANHSFRWTIADGMQDLGIPPGFTQTTDVGMSGDGSIIIGVAARYEGGMIVHPFLPFRWIGGGFQELGRLPGWAVATVVRISADGSTIIGEATTSPGDSCTARAIRWVGDGEAQNLGILPGTCDSRARDVSDNGAVIVGQCTLYQDSTASRAFRWTAAGGMQNLGQAVGQIGSKATFVSGNGLVIVGLSTSQGGPFIWTSTTGIVLLEQYLLARGVNLSEWSLGEIDGISFDGSAIFGRGGYSPTPSISRQFVIRNLWVPCTTAPTVAVQPANKTADPSGSATFSVIISGPGPLTYRWQIESTPAGSGVWTDLTDGVLPAVFGSVAVAAGAATANLTISNADPASALRYRCRVSNSCGSTTSGATTLGVTLPNAYIVELVHGQVAQGFRTGTSVTLVPDAWTYSTLNAINAKWTEMNQARTSMGLASLPCAVEVFDWANDTGRGVQLTAMSRVFAILTQVQILNPFGAIPWLIDSLLYEQRGREVTSQASRIAAVRLANRLNVKIEQAFAAGMPSVFIDLVAHSRGTAVSAEALRLLASLRRSSSEAIPIAVSITYLDAIDPDTFFDPDLIRPLAKAGFLLGDPTLVPTSTGKQASFYAGHAALAPNCMSTGEWFGDLTCKLSNLGIVLGDTFLLTNGYPRGHSRPNLFATVEGFLADDSHTTLSERYPLDLASMPVGAPSSSPFMFESTSYFGARLADPTGFFVTPGTPGGPPLFPGAQAGRTTQASRGTGQPLNLIADPDFTSAQEIIDKTSNILADAEFQAVLTPDMPFTRQFLESIQSDQFVAIGWDRSGPVTLEQSPTGALARMGSAACSLSQMLDAAAGENARFMVNVTYGFANVNGTLDAELSDAGMCGQSSVTAAQIGVLTTQRLRFIASRCDNVCQPIQAIPAFAISGNDAYLLHVSVVPISPVTGDADASGDVAFGDITSVLANWGADYLEAAGTGLGDADVDGVVTFADITTVLANFGETCP